MLHEFLTEHRAELIDHCSARLAKRYAPEPMPEAAHHGVPLFLEQLIDTLKAEQRTVARPEFRPGTPPAHTVIGRSATRFGMALLRHGYTVEDVVHYYGDVCQSVTELADRDHASITPDEYRTFNRCTDEAIADAVTAFASEREAAVLDQAASLHHRLGLWADEQRKLIDLSIQTVAAIQAGSVPVTGATGAALTRTLLALRELADVALPEIRLITGMTSTPPDRDDAS